MTLSKSPTRSRWSVCPAPRQAAATPRIDVSTIRSSTPPSSSTSCTWACSISSRTRAPRTTGSGEAFTATEVSLGAEYAGASVDAFYTKVKDAVSIGALSADQVTGLPALGYALDNSLVGTISDNASFGAMASYAFGPATFFGAYQHITYMNPSIKLDPGFDDIGGYTLAYVNNTAYAKADKILQVYWAGVRYTVNEQLTAAIAYYGEKQNAYATGADFNCTATISGACSGNLNAASVSLVYHFTKRFDSYAGAMWSHVSHGLANGYIETTMIDPTVGFRYSF
jgi:predicted porin